MKWQEFKVNIPEGESGSWKVERFEVSKADEDFQRLRAAFGNTRGRFVPAGLYTRLTRNGTVIMSDTPDEIRDHYEPIRLAKWQGGRCLVHGLGLGMVTRAMLLVPEVQDVTVVDMSPDVISLVGPTLKEEFGDRLNIIEDNALTWKPPKGVLYEVVWHDIWDNISADNVEEMKTLHRRFGRRSEWQGSWARDICEDMRRSVR